MFFAVFNRQGMVTDWQGGAGARWGRTGLASSGRLAPLDDRWLPGAGPAQAPEAESAPGVGVGSQHGTRHALPRRRWLSLGGGCWLSGGGCEGGPWCTHVVPGTCWLSAGVWGVDAGGQGRRPNGCWRQTGRWAAVRGSGPGLGPWPCLLQWDAFGLQGLPCACMHVCACVQVCVHVQCVCTCVRACTVWRGTGVQRCLASFLLEPLGALLAGGQPAKPGSVCVWGQQGRVWFCFRAASVAPCGAPDVSTEGLLGHGGWGSLWTCTQSRHVWPPAAHLEPRREWAPRRPGLLGPSGQAEPARRPWPGWAAHATGGRGPSV